MSVEVQLPVGYCDRERMSLGVGFTVGSRTPSPGCQRGSPALVRRHTAPAGPGLAPRVDQNGTDHCAECARLEAMSARDLANRMMQPYPFLLLDCRCFIAYNLSHISGALNLSCGDRLTRRRLAGGRASVADLVSGPEAKTLFRSLEGADVVIYDDETADLSHLTTQHPLHLVFTSLVKSGKKAFILTGGLKEFQANYGQLCASPKPIPDSKQRLYSPTTPVVEPMIETATASPILPFLYLGNERDSSNAERLRELGVTHILNVTAHSPHCFEDNLKYKRLPASDSAHQNLKQYFQDACAFIEDAGASGGKVLIHCQAGVSRSATITIAYIMKRTELSMVDAYKYVKNKRCIIAPNFNFMGQLLEFEGALRDGVVEQQLEPALTLDQSCL